MASPTPCPTIAIPPITPGGIAPTIGQTNTDFGCIPNDPVLFVQKFYGIGLGLIGGVSILSIIFGGYLILTSQGNQDQLRKGKSYIFYAIGGIVLAIFGFIFVQFILVDTLHIPGFFK